MASDLSLQQKLSKFSKNNKHFKHFYENIGDLNEADPFTSKSLQFIARELLQHKHNYDEILHHFNNYMPILIDIFVSFTTNCPYSYHKHLINCLVLGWLVTVRPDMQSYALLYFNKYSSPFDDNSGNEADPSKKRKIDRHITDLEIVEAVYSLLKSNPNYYRNKWQWSKFLHFLHGSANVQWIACRTLGIVFGMDGTVVKKLINKHMTIDLAEQCILKFDKMQTLQDKLVDETVSSMSTISDKQLDSSLVRIENFYFHAVGTHISFNLILTPTTKKNLRRICLAANSETAVCLQGTVGSGKTTLVEYLAAETGRKLGENFIKIQLGDQTDSKTLLGTFCCTDVPGEFIWRPGVLTQAVLDGSWLLLEDIDCAGMDVATLLAGLLENKSLCVPGFRDSLPLSNNFKLFLTRRMFLDRTTGTLHSKPSNVASILENHLTQTTIEILPLEELIEIVKIQYPAFETIADRIVKVFDLVTVKDVPTKVKRLVSTRDLFKWCTRSLNNFDVSNQASALNLLQEAIDVFCSSYSNIDDMISLAREISCILGIIPQKAEQLINSYKPNIEITPQHLKVGRGNLIRLSNTLSTTIKFSFTRPTSVLLERIVRCVEMDEPVLLVGETGTGKTSSIQFLANTIGQKLIVINMNQQSDSSDLLGGFKPIGIKYTVEPIKQEFEQLFCEYFKIEPNKTYLRKINLCYEKEKWIELKNMMHKSYNAAIQRLKLEMNSNNIEKVQKANVLYKKWSKLGKKLHKFSNQIKQKTALAFAFIEGTLIKAVKEGWWVLLDEINLANGETLECLSGLLESKSGSLCLLDRGDKVPVKRNPNFTLFACMNPSTDVGKKDLPPGLRNRFTEFFVDELRDTPDLLLLVSNYLEAMLLKKSDLQRVVDFYLQVRQAMITTLSDGVGHKPHFSLRSLCRALTVAAQNPCGNFKRSLYEAFCLSFLTQLDLKSYQVVNTMIARIIIGDENTTKAILNQTIVQPKDGKFIQFEGYWVKVGQETPFSPKNYILTHSVRQNLKDLVRVVSIGNLPVLLQGDTSVGKTSLINYLAKASGNKCVRINNHEHIDLQEYIGSYVADPSGKLIFRNGLLVEAMLNGHWIILDELNLAPTDVLEALNRVLDDNRELFIPETQQIIKAHKNFILFATQNPPGSYGGRKVLSRAFRNRFVELHFNEIPPKELKEILQHRCNIPPSYSDKMLNVMTDLQIRRRGSAAFAGKKGFITLRDLFRWGERYHLASITEKLYDWDQHLADEGYLVLAGRVRMLEEKQEICNVLEKFLKRKINPNNLFTLSTFTSPVTVHILKKLQTLQSRHPHIVWTYNMRQMAVQIVKAIEFKEPILLVGSTGSGKTTICKIIADINDQELLTINCHMNLESSDFIGGLRPNREYNDDKLFEWVDGPLINAMINGNMFLADEISLADDSVLERLNSLLEPERSVLLAERAIDITGSLNYSEQVTAHEKFVFIGTMNPGGDFGKKELSPALRNRFTEIWCEACTDRNDIIAIIENNLFPKVYFENENDGSTGIGYRIVNFLEWFHSTEIGSRFTISIRDVLTWVKFLNLSTNFNIQYNYIYGATVSFLDSFGSGNTNMETLKRLQSFKSECVNYLLRQVNLTEFIENQSSVSVVEDRIGIDPFYIKIGKLERQSYDFTFEAPTTQFNTVRLLRAMQLKKAILLEGSPGVGKTTLVTALAKLSGYEIYRINLSQQTDISDLFGADLPVEGGIGGQFAWRDGPLLQALKKGSWIILDELNLASQSVLEGLNACLDHRGEIFIPELGKTFFVQAETNIFACQNPLKQGGNRRGLPQSFLNRFVQVYIDTLTCEDLQLILTAKYPLFPKYKLNQMLKFHTAINNSQVINSDGGPWDCNLRDISRWCEVTAANATNGIFRPECFIEMIYSDRMRNSDSRQIVHDTYKSTLGYYPINEFPLFYFNENVVCFGDARINRMQDNVHDVILNNDDDLLILRQQLPILRSLTHCVNMKWMTILVGGPGSGKSSIVKILAGLVGKTVKTLSVTSLMDTTDILGGFEQTDYSRHLDELIKDCEKLYLSTVHVLLMASDYSNTKLLCEHWEEFFTLQNSGQHFLSNETKLFIQKLHKLQEILEFIGTFSPNDEASKLVILKNKLCNLLQKITNNGSLTAGGKFEWVDSTLVKCLQKGHWLIVDNVNLCSAAVLDRLNVLLEPNGTLTLTERGLDKDGTFSEIIPHPEFRIFFTMDQRNGEISRAMRNRGVEIYLLENLNTLSIEDWDLQNLLQMQYGNDNVIRILLEIYEYLIKNFSFLNPPRINNVIRYVKTFKKQIINGIKPLNSIIFAVLEMCISLKLVNEEASKDKLELMICKKFDGIKAQDFYTENNQDFTFRMNNLLNDSDLENIKQDFLLLTSNNTSTSKSKHFFIQFLVSYYTMGTKSNLSLRHQYLNQNYNLAVTNLMYNILNDIPLNSHLTFDFRWRPQLEHTLQNESNANTLFLKLNVVQFLYEESIFLKDNSKKLLSENKFLLLEYIYERKKNAVGDKFGSPVIGSFLKLIELYDLFVHDLIKTIINLDNKSVFIILILLNWRILFHRTTLVNIRGLSENQIYGLVTNINIHYNWLFKSYSKLKELYKLSTIESLENLFIKINAQLGRQFSKLHKIGRNFRKAGLIVLPIADTIKLNLRNKIQTYLKLNNIFEIHINSLDIVAKFIAFPHLRLLLLRLITSETIKEEDVNSIDVYEQKHKLNLVSKKAACSFKLFKVVDYFNRLLIKNYKILDLTTGTRFLESNILLPIELCDYLLKLPNGIFTKAFYMYLLNSLCVSPFKLDFCDTDINQENAGKQIMRVHNFGPLLTTSVFNAIMDSNGKFGATYGNFQQILKEHKFIRTLLGKQMVQMTEVQYDFLYNEHTNLHDAYQNFIKQLAQVFEPTNVPTENLARELLKKVNEHFCHQMFDEYIGCFQNKLFKLIENMERLPNLSGQEKLIVIADSYTCMGYLKLIMDGCLTTIDPLAKKVLKIKHLSDFLDQLNDTKHFYNVYSKFKSQGKWIHPFINPIKESADNISKKVDKLKRFRAVRCNFVTYEALIKDVNHSFETIFSASYVNNILNNLNEDLNKVNNALKTSETSCDFISKINVMHYSTALSTYKALVFDWSKYKISYPDIIEVLLHDAAQFVYGFNLKVEILTQSLEEYYLKCYNINQLQISNLIRLPSKNGIETMQQQISLTSSKIFLKFLNYLYGNSKTAQRESITLLRTSILESFNICLLFSKSSENLNCDLFADFTQLLKMLLQSYTEQELKRENEEKATKSLYAFRTQCEFKPESEEIEEEFASLFPNFRDKDFFEDEEKLSDESEINKEFNCAVITEDDISFVSKLHIQLLLNFTKTEWLNPKKANLSLNIIQPFMEKASVFRRLLPKVMNAASFKLDQELVGSFLAIIAAETNHYNIDQNCGLNSNTYDFYHDANVEEVKSSVNIILNLKRHVENTLLIEWPQQPTLQSIVKVINRILSFELISPLSRFLVGFEILLNTCHEWEQVAHSGVSLSLFSSEITQQIIAWRKLELSMWKNILNKAYEKLNKPMAKYWINIYTIMEEYIFENIFTAEELKNTLQQFLVQSNLAEFDGRLELLYVFHCHASCLKSTNKSKEFLSILWNVYQYFRQYSELVATKIKDLRAPIEKKLKEYVKIVRWKDMSYWTIKETMEKSHKMVHKFVRDYQDVLRQSVSAHILQLRTTGEENSEFFNRSETKSHIILNPDAYQASLTLLEKYRDSTEESALQMEKHFIKSRKFCKEIISHSKYPDLIKSLDTFTFEVIERSSALQKISVNTSLSQEKQKSQGKQILQQKQRALADLFKSLTKIGLSYRNGIIESKLRKSVDAFLIEPIDLSASFKHFSLVTKNEKMLTFWENCEFYFNRSLMRFDIFEHTLLNPSKDIGVQNIQRCKGFATDLIHTLLKQKSALVITTRRYYYLHYYLRQFTEFCEGTDFISAAQFNNTVNILNNVTMIMNQYIIIMDAYASETSSDEYNYMEPLSLPSVNNTFTSKNDLMWKETYHIIYEVKHQAEKMTNLLHKNHSTIFSKANLMTPNFVSLPQKSKIYVDLTEVHKNIGQLITIFGDGSLSDSLKWLASKLEVQLTSFNNVEGTEKVDIINISKRIKKLTYNLLMAIEKLFKVNKNTCASEWKEESEDLFDNHLLLLTETLNIDVKTLNMDRIFSITQNIAQQLSSYSPMYSKQLNDALLCSIPIFEQMLRLYEYTITEQVSFYRVSCKMTSIILKIFIELGSKGFCIPPEVSKEVMEDVGNPSDGMGLGEGQGERDVSDKIESEDQLDDASAGDEKRPDEEDPECKEEENGIEMSEDFDSKLQDKDKNDSNDESSDSSCEEQMGETEDFADNLDQELWGSDQEQDDENSSNKNGEEKPNSEKQDEKSLGAKENDSLKTTDNEKGNEQLDKDLENTEFDDDQTDPYHNNQTELAPPEPMDIPENLQLDDDGEISDNNEENSDENSLNASDDDTMKEDITDINHQENTEMETNEDEEKEFSDDEGELKDQLPIDKQESPSNDPQDTVLETVETNKSQSTEQEQINPMNTCNEPANSNKEKTNELNSNETAAQEDEFSENDDAVGQSKTTEMSSNCPQSNQGTQGLTISDEDRSVSKQQKSKESDIHRTLGEVEKSISNIPKLISNKSVSKDPKKDQFSESSEMAQHLEDEKDECQQILDVATKEQREEQKELLPTLNEESFYRNEPNETDKSEDFPENISSNEIKKSLSLLKDKKSDNQAQKNKAETSCQIIDRNFIETSSVSRGPNSSHHTILSKFSKTTKLTYEELTFIRKQIQQELATCNENHINYSKAQEIWCSISNLTTPAARNLAEQLRLILEPTLNSHLQGDFRTGRRINMRKIIPYIASQFRKDKIWLRRTKPCKREYKIILAIDDSSSMADNHSKEMALESIALISKALSILESGDLGILGFGESINVVHKLSEPFREENGTRLLRHLKFVQTKTCIAKLLDFVTIMIQDNYSESFNNPVANLLLIISDGRGIFAEGETVVLEAVRRIRMANIFVVFVVIDNPASKNSILDIRMPVFRNGKLENINNYMDAFPFSFYIVLKDIEMLPNVLSDALRQWFEIVTNLED